MTHHATNLIADYFREKEMKFSVHDVDGASYVDAGFSIPCGPAVMVHFISRDEDNDVAIRIFSLISSIPSAKEDGRLQSEVQQTKKRRQYANISVKCSYHTNKLHGGEHIVLHTFYTGRKKISTRTFVRRLFF